MRPAIYGLDAEKAGGVKRKGTSQKIGRCVSGKVVSRETFCSVKRRLTAERGAQSAFPAVFRHMKTVRFPLFALSFPALQKFSEDICFCAGFCYFRGAETAEISQPSEVRETLYRISCRLCVPVNIPYAPTSNRRLRRNNLPAAIWFPDRAPIGPIRDRKVSVA